jgi:hypothetical protein
LAVIRFERIEASTASLSALRYVDICGEGRDSLSHREKVPAERVDEGSHCYGPRPETGLYEAARRDE